MQRFLLRIPVCFGSFLGLAPAATAAPIEGQAAAELKSDDRLRPRNEAALLGNHAVESETSHYKPGTGLTFTSKDGRYELATRLRAQFRYTFRFDGEDGESKQGLQIRRARLQFKGHVFNKHNKFKTEFAFAPRDMGFNDVPTRTPILDWYFDFTYLRDLTIRLGQSKLPYSRQRVVSSGDLQLVNRSIANGEFNVDRDIGIDIRSKDFLGWNKVRYYAGVYLGEGRDQYQLTDYNMLYVARVEFLPFGMFKDYKEVDFERSFKPRLSVGAGYAYADGAIRNRGSRGAVPSDGGTTDAHNVNVDFVFKMAGLSVLGDVFYRQGRRNAGTATVVDDAGDDVLAPVENARNGLGWVGQAGFLIPRIPLEIAGRYGQVLPLGTATSLSRRDEAGGGLSYYFAGHPLKLQLDYFALWSDGAIDNVDHLARVQLQAAF